MKNHKSNLMNYITGYILSILATLAAFIIAKESLVSGWILVYVILSIAILQLVVQAVFFLHLSEEDGPKLNLTTFYFMIMVVSILVVGSLWIMKNLDYNMMPEQQNQHMLDQYNEGGF
ncbi:cytochrome o ubiquinol oxidase subunit IV [Candidatus Saccharibacteria bacterium]|nr:cytochrome o ubiquinol oxidase subunit IV [Candidatus Saccharibacteria bacterium]